MAPRRLCKQKKVKPWITVKPRRKKDARKARMMQMILNHPDNIKEIERVYKKQFDKILNWVMTGEPYEW